MGRTAKAKSAETQNELGQETQTPNEQKQKQDGETNASENANSEGKVEVEEKVGDNIVALMKLHPQYEQFYVTPKGFVHPFGVPEYLRKDAKLYKNKYYNK